jgi:TolA-binding protein
MEEKMKDGGEQQPKTEALDELKEKLKEQESELSKLRQLNELLLERMNKKDKKAVKAVTSGEGGAEGEQKYENFEVKKVPVRHAHTNEIIDYDHVVTFTNSEAITYLRGFVVRPHLCTNIK